MSGPSWLVDSKRIATKIKSASATCDPRKVKWKSNPSKACPKCNHIIDNSDITQEWPGLPKGVKFDPSDQEIIWHLLSKVGEGKLHPFIDEFVPTVDEDEGICYTHPQNLPGVKQDGSVSHFFHRAIKAYNTGSRKRRKIIGDDLGDVRWHKTGKTKPVFLDGMQRGCKKIMVLYMSMAKGGKPEKTNWVMHQYHLGTGEDEKDGEFVISKIFHQQQGKQGIEQDLPSNVPEAAIVKVDPVTPKAETPEPRSSERQHSDLNVGQEPSTSSMRLSALHPKTRSIEEGMQPEIGNLDDQDHLQIEDYDKQHCNLDVQHESVFSCMKPAQDPEIRYVEDEQQWEKFGNQEHQEMKNRDDHMMDNCDHNEEDPKWWEGESQYILDSQQLVEGLSLCDELLQSQPSNADGNGEERNPKFCLSDYAHLGPEDLKKDLEECQNLALLEHGDIQLDTPPDYRLSQLDFGSQDSFFNWAGTKAGD